MMQLHQLLHREQEHIQHHPQRPCVCVWCAVGTRHGWWCRLGLISTIWCVDMCIVYVCVLMDL